MSLTANFNASNDLVIVSDKRKHPAVPAETQDARITVETLNSDNSVIDTVVLPYSIVTKPAKPAYNDPIKVTDDSGAVWAVVSDDGTTAVYRKSA